MGLRRVAFMGLCLLFLGVSTVPVNSASIVIFDSLPDYNSRVCVQGPTYWCKNITTAKECNAVKHCIQTVWELQTLPADDDNVCQICKDMVAQARAQLESNETQEELREVFEGSCKLLPIKIVRAECIKLSDEFIPELVETLASQMNPQVVCSVAGLCNNARIDRLLETQNEISEEFSNDITSPDKCEGCASVARLMEQKFLSAPRDDILNNMVEACGKLGSFSDGCAAIVITHFESLYAHLKKNFNGDGLCHLSGMCQYKFHTHEEEENANGIEVVHTSSVGVLKPQKKDGACDMCQQLVLHLRDFLVANTTEVEFEQVLKGLCKQFKSFKTQCLSIVEEYYAVIYDFMVNELNPKEVCSLLAICRPPTLKEQQSPLWPLVPAEAVHNYEAHKAIADKNVVNAANRPIIGRDEANSLKVHRVSLKSDSVGVRVADASLSASLPIERMLPQTITYVSNKQLCTFCEYFLHYLQVALTSHSTEVEIKKVVDEGCDHLPQTIEEQCRSFVDTYGDALVALLAQEIDPSQVCPKLGLCPSSQVLVDVTQIVEDKPVCPLCLFAVEEIITKLKDNKTEEGIRKALDELCEDLPKSLVGECRTFVENYSESLVDMIVADFTPQEVCAYLKICDPPSISPSSGSSSSSVLTNEVPQLPVERLMPKTLIDAVLERGQPHVEESTTCVLCEFVLSKIDAALKDQATEEEIAKVVHDVCNWMPKTVVAECNKFVDEYANLVIQLLAQNIDPKEVCTEVKLCQQQQLQLQSVSGAVDQCVVCDALLGALEGAMEDPDIDRDAAKALQKVCSIMPKKDEDKCKSMVKIYGPSILNLLARETPIQYICEKLGLCAQNRQVVNLLGGKRCTWGPTYWCQSVAHANSCGAIAHCQERVWKAEKPSE